MSMRRVETVETGCQRFEVWKSAVQVEFRVAGAVHAWWHRRRLLTGLAWDNLAAACLLRPAGPPRSVLMLGLAGGTSLRVLRHLLPGCRFTAVEIDPGIVELARREMALDELGIAVELGDAYRWLRHNRRTFDVVVDDVYLAGRHDVFRPVAWRPEQLSSLRRAVAPGGLLAANLVTGRGHRSVQSAIRRAFRAGFPVVRSVTTPDSLNETLVGGRQVATAAAWKPWLERFADPQDRRLWRRLRARKL
jgi:spermidine synthase